MASLLSWFGSKSLTNSVILIMCVPEEENPVTLQRTLLVMHSQDAAFLLWPLTRHKQPLHRALTPGNKSGGVIHQ